MPQAAYPVAFCSALHDGPPPSVAKTQTNAVVRRKPVSELNVDGEYPHIKNGIDYFVGIHFAFQEIKLNANEDFVLQEREFVQSLLTATRTTDDCMAEDL